MADKAQPVQVARDVSYRPCPIPEGEGNPLYEVLAPMAFDKAEAIELLHVVPEFKPAELELPPEHRLVCPMRLRHFMFPGNDQIDLYRTISMAIRGGYRFRNPRTVEGQRKLYSNGERACLPVHAHGQILLLRGPSGVGKTASFSRSLACVAPDGAQVIVHKSYNGEPYNDVQIVYLSVQLQRTGERSCKALLQEIGKELERLLAAAGYKHPATVVFHRKTAAELGLREAVVSLLANYNVGMLVIDDVQFLIEKTGVNNSIVSLLVALSAEVGLPVLLVGTANAVKLVERSETLASRIADGGFFTMSRGVEPEISEGKVIDPSGWDAFISVLEMYQWTKTELKFDEDWRKEFYDLTQGVHRFAIALYIAAQRRAIVNGGAEEVTVDVLKETFNRDMRAIHPLVKALNSKNIADIAQYEEMYCEASAALNKKEAAVRATREDVENVLHGVVLAQSASDLGAPTTQ